MLARSVRDNGFDDRCKICQAGVGSDPGKAFIHAPVPLNPGASFVRTSASDPNDIAVDIVRLDDVDFDRRIEAMKMDVEGFEGRVIEGGLEFLRKHRPVVLSEFCPPMMLHQGGTDAVEYLRLWKDLGYELRLFDPEGGPARPIGPEVAQQDDIISIVSIPTS